MHTSYGTVIHGSPSYISSVSNRKPNIGPLITLKNSRRPENLISAFAVRPTQPLPMCPCESGACGEMLLTLSWVVTFSQGELYAPFSVCVHPIPFSECERPQESHTSVSPIIVQVENNKIKR